MLISLPQTLTENIHISLSFEEITLTSTVHLAYLSLHLLAVISTESLHTLKVDQIGAGLAISVASEGQAM